MDHEEAPQAGERATGRRPSGHRINPRHPDRRTAIDVLYQADMTGTTPTEVLDEWRAVSGEPEPVFTRSLLEGVEAHQEAIDALIGETAEGWTVERLAAVDRAILRLAVFELLWLPETPVAVAVSEAVEAARELSTEDSGRFVNGVLGKVARERAAERPG